MPATDTNFKSVTVTRPSGDDAEAIAASQRAGTEADDLFKLKIRVDKANDVADETFVNITMVEAVGGVDLALLGSRFNHSESTPR